MALFIDLPTTGSISFAQILEDPSTSSSGAQSTRLVLQATSSRQRLRLALKQCRRASANTKDYSAVLVAIQDYLPHLRWIKSCLEKDELVTKSQMSFSWRPVLSHNKFQKSKRITLSSLSYELSFCCLTYGLVLINLASRTVVAAGNYESIRFTPELERKRLDAELNSAADLLCRAAGIFKYLSEVVVSSWNDLSPHDVKQRPLDITCEIATALSNLAMAYAERIAIRRLLSKAMSDNSFAPGPPLPRSHPSPSLLAKLQLNVASLLASASSLSQSACTKSNFSIDDDLVPWLRKYIEEGLIMSRALAYKWLGVDLGEGGTKIGEAVAWLMLADRELERLVPKFQLGKKTAEKKQVKNRLMSESDSISGFLKSYKRINDRVTFQPIPASETLLSKVPGGRSALAIKPFQMPAHISTSRDGNETSFDMAVEGLHLDDDSDEDSSSPVTSLSTANYALSSEYF